MSEVILLQDGELARALADARLGPLRELPAGERVRLTETLAAWLAHHRHTPQIAEELHVHPQTVRYRVLGRAVGTLDSWPSNCELALAAQPTASPASSVPMTEPISARARTWSSARAMYSAASSKAPMRTWARGVTGCGAMRPTSIA